MPVNPWILSKFPLFGDVSVLGAAAATTTSTSSSSSSSTSSSSTSTSSTSTTTESYIAQYQTVYDSMTTKPSADTADADNTMVSTLVGASLWSDKFDVFDVFAQEVNTDGEALKNFINPGTNDPSIGAGPPTFTALEGFTGNGTSAYINFLNPGDGGTYKYLRNSASIGIYIRNNINEGTYVFGSQGACDQLLQPRSAAGDNCYTKLNDNTTVTINPVTNSSGLWILSRTAAAVVRVYRNGTDIGGGTSSSAALLDQMFFLFGLNNAGTPALFSNHQVSLAFAGGGLTAPQVTTITNAIEARMDAVGKGVIP